MTDAEKLAVYDELEAAARQGRDAILQLRIKIEGDVISIEGQSAIIPAAEALVGVLLKIDLSDRRLSS